MADAAQRSKWEQYYAADPRAAPWDTHAISSQLRTYLCACRAYDAEDVTAAASADASPAPAEPRTMTPPAADPNGGGRGGGGTSASGGGGGPALLHVCARCAPLKPAAARGASGVHSGRRVRALELCCGTGASLAFMCGLGYSVAGVELVAAACQLAAERLAAAAGGGTVAVQSVEAVAETLLRWDAADATDAEGSSRAPHPTTQSRISPLPGPLTEATAPPGAESPPEAAVACPPPERGSLSSSAAAETAETVKAAPGPVVRQTGTPGREGREPAAAMEGARSVVARGDLFAATLPRGYFDFAYDCQGLHAMPPALRPAYVAVLRGALRSGGLALLLVGRAEEDEAQDSMETAAAPPPPPARLAPPAGALKESGNNGADGVAACGEVASSSSSSRAKGDGSGGGGAGGGGTDPRVGGGSVAGAPAPSSRGPSLMSREELRELFGSAQDWQWCWCRATRFDSTPVYARLPQPPPAWCLLVRRR